jgi:hypothetical protein
MLDAVEHLVDVAVEPSEFIVHVGNRDPPSEVAGLYFEGSSADGANPMLKLSAKH